MESQDPASKKGQGGAELYSATSPLVLSAENPERPGHSQPLNFQFPNCPPVSHPFLESIRPLTSTGLFSPPSNLPLVSLPDHPPISPIARDTNLVTVGLDSPRSIPEQGDKFKPSLQLSNVQNWLQNLSPEPEWDTYFRTPPTYSDQQAFWESREANTQSDLEVSPDRNIFSPVRLEKETIQY